MGEMFAKVPAKEMSLEAVIIRADGTRENLGTIAYYNENWFKQLLYKLRSTLGI